MQREFPRKHQRDEQPSILCFSDTINRRPLPAPPGSESLSASALHEDSQLKEFERLLQTSKNKEISGYIEEESVSFLKDGPKSRGRRGFEEVSVGLSKLAGIVLALGEKVDRVEQRLGRVEKKLDRGFVKSVEGPGEQGYKAHTISSNLRSRAKTGAKKKGSSTVSLGNSVRTGVEGSLQAERLRALERETQELRARNKALKIDKNILMKMIKDMIDKNPEALKAIDQEKFMKTLEDP